MPLVAEEEYVMKSHSKQIIATPTSSPLYPPPPYECKNSETIYFIYHTNPEEAKVILPEPLVLAPDPQVCVMMRYLNFPDTLGSYGETIINILSLYGNIIGWYIAYIYCASDRALAAGREIWGTPKKFGITEISKSGSALKISLKKEESVLISASVEIEGESDPSEMMRKYQKEKIHNFCLKVIPNAMDGHPEIKQLISLTREKLKIKAFWRCSGTIRLMSGSAGELIENLSPMDKPMVFYDICDYALGYGKILHDYLKTG
jgi:acetoacetate decarboxylase